MAFTVEIKFKDGRTETMNNVTEIHYNYESIIAKSTGKERIAFESDINYTGCTYNIEDIEEFEAIQQPRSRDVSSTNWQLEAVGGLAVL